MSNLGRELEGLNVLLVDDAASSAADGLAALDCAVPAVILSDIGMPDMNGYDFMRAIRERAPDRGGSTTAVALTAFSTQEDRRCALEAGFQMHVSKPIELHELASILATVSRSPSQFDGPVDSR
jgi:CheY-like chemotaxis protein